MSSELVKIITPFLCDIRELILTASYEYEIEFMTSIVSAISECVPKRLNTLLLSYALLHQNADHITVNEIALRKRICNIQNLYITVRNNINRVIELLRDNVLKHRCNNTYHNVTLFTSSLNTRFCYISLGVLPYVKKLSVRAFVNTIHSTSALERCKTIIIKGIKHLHTRPKSLTVVFHSWKIHIQGIQMEVEDRQQPPNNSTVKANDGVLLLTFCQIILSNLALIVMCPLLLVQVRESFLSRLKVAVLNLVLFSLVVVILFLLTLISWVPGERVLKYREPVVYHDRALIPDWDAFMQYLHDLI